MSGSRLRWIGVIVGLLGLLLMAWGAWSYPAAFFPSYLVACLYWTEISVGSLALLMIHSRTAVAQTEPGWRPGGKKTSIGTSPSGGSR